MDLDIIAILVRGHGSLQVLPPQIQQPLFANETEPRRKQQLGIFHHINELLSGDPFDGIHFIRVWLDGQLVLGLDTKEEYIINFMFSPGTA